MYSTQQIIFKVLMIAIAMSQIDVHRTRGPCYDDTTSDQPHALTKQMQDAPLAQDIVTAAVQSNVILARREPVRHPSFGYHTREAKQIDAMEISLTLPHIHDGCQLINVAGSVVPLVFTQRCRQIILQGNYGTLQCMG